jgi:hypothetical protein
LLYEQGFTISGARNQLHEHTQDHVQHQAPDGDAFSLASSPNVEHALQTDEPTMNLLALKASLEQMAPEALLQLRESLLDIRNLLAPTPEAHFTRGTI